jgi:hypothetical protein
MYISWVSEKTSMYGVLGIKNSRVFIMRPDRARAGKLVKLSPALNIFWTISRASSMSDSLRYKAIR